MHHLEFRFHLAINLLYCHKCSVHKRLLGGTIGVDGVDPVFQDPQGMKPIMNPGAGLVLSPQVFG